jgi:hypothetical protein
MMTKSKRFSEEIKLRALLWSNRHCCVCDNRCGLDIEVAHIDPTGGENFDNAIPVCYTHHAQIGRYNNEHPRGNKYRIIELKKRREQIYEKYTRHLIPPLLWYLVPRLGDPRPFEFELPRVGFVIENHGVHLPTKLKVMVSAFLGGKEIDVRINPKKPYYNQRITWNLNSGHNFYGNFSLDKRCVNSNDSLIVEVKITAIDTYERPHDLLPNCYTCVRKEKRWFTEPTSFDELKKYMYPKK